MSYIGIVLIIIISVFLGTKYYLYIKDSELDKTTTEITKYPNLVCNKTTNTDNYSKNNIVTMAFNKDSLVWLRDLSAYYYSDIDEYTTAKNELDTTEKNIYTNSFYDDNLTIIIKHEGEINDLQNSDWSIETNTYTYDNLIKYYQDKEYTCELNN